jgi:hypothetical protein
LKRLRETVLRDFLLFYVDLVFAKVRYKKRLLRDVPENLGVLFAQG